MTDISMGFNQGRSIRVRRSKANIYQAAQQQKKKEKRKPLRVCHR
jgi:hypothetical protein